MAVGIKINVLIDKSIANFQIDFTLNWRNIIKPSLSQKLTIDQKNQGSGLKRRLREQKSAVLAQADLLTRQEIVSGVDAVGLHKGQQHVGGFIFHLLFVENAVKLVVTRVTVDRFGLGRSSRGGCHSLRTGLCEAVRVTAMIFQAGTKHGHG